MHAPKHIDFQSPSFVDDKNVDTTVAKLTSLLFSFEIAIVLVLPVYARFGGNYALSVWVIITPIIGWSLIKLFDRFAPMLSWLARKNGMKLDTAVSLVCFGFVVFFVAFSFWLGHTLNLPKARETLEELDGIFDKATLLATFLVHALKGFFENRKFRARRRAVSGDEVGASVTHDEMFAAALPA
jgi:hypothetical protein